MRSKARSSLILGLAALSLMASAAAAGAAAEHADQFTGNLVNTQASARSSQPFILGIDHYATSDDLQQLAAALRSKNRYAVRDELWKKSAGFLSIGGRLGYPVAEVFSFDTPAGRKLYAVIDRPMRQGEVQNGTRSSRYPFSVVELNIDRNGRGEGTFIAAAKLKVRADTLEVISLGVQPFRLLKVQPG
jgi:hypothetical protein